MTGQLQTDFSGDKMAGGQLAMTGAPLSKKEVKEKIKNYTDHMGAYETLLHYGGMFCKNAGVIADVTGIGLPAGVGMDFAGALLQGKAQSLTERKILKESGHNPDDATGVIVGTAKHIVPFLN
jgi:hypothetical protein